MITGLIEYSQPRPERQEILTSSVWPGSSVLATPLILTVMGAPSARSRWTRATSVVNWRCSRYPR